MSQYFDRKLVLRSHHQELILGSIILLLLSVLNSLWLLMYGRVDFFLLLILCVVVLGLLGWASCVCGGSL